MLSSADPGGKQQSAAFRRKDQLDRWANSSTDNQPIKRKENSTKVNFTSGTVFLAACSQCDKKEVEELIRDGVNPNTFNVDGLTALHQSCIDDNISMVEFLINNGAEVNVADNEGWTPLHATASCGYIDIASYLINNGANIAACNSDGDLAIDIAEGSDMENLLAASMNSQSINADEARTAEERLMMADANNWIQKPGEPERENPKTGATSLHVAAAKGYHRVMLALIQAGANVNHQDTDGWTPLHGAAHWGQEESCKILMEGMCDMEMKNFAGRSAVDVADESLVKLLRELTEKQKTLKAQNRKDSLDDMIISNRPKPLNRRSSVTRMSIDEKEKLVHNSSLEERGTALTNRITEDSEQEESKELPAESAEEKSPQITAPEVAKKEPEPKKEAEKRPQTSPTEETAAAKNAKNDEDQFNELLMYRRASGSDYDVPASNSGPSPTSWRAGLRKTGSTGAVPETSSMADRKQIGMNAVKKSASFGVINDTNEGKSDVASGATASSSMTGSVPMRTERRAFAALRDQGATDRSSYPLTAGRSNYIPYYKRQQMEREAKDAANTETAAAAAGSGDVPSPAVSAGSRTPSLSRSESEPERPERRTSRYEAPKRDEEAEANRKIKAKRARETRRSTQSITKFELPSNFFDIIDGVTQDDVKAAEATLKIAETKPTTLLTESAASKPTAAGDQEKVSTSSTTVAAEEPKRRSYQREEGTRSSFRKARDIISGNSSSSSVPDTLAAGSSQAYTSRYRPEEERPERQRYSWRNSTSSQNGGADSNKENNEEDNKSKEDDDDKNKPRLLRSRRNRRERRSTGVIYYDENEKQEDEKDQDTTETTDQTISPDNGGGCAAPATGWGSRPFSSRRYGSASDVPTQMASSGGVSDRAGDRSSYHNRYSRRQPTTGTSLENSTSEAMDYKKLYEEMKSENDVLKAQMEAAAKENKDLKESLASRLNNSTTSNGESLSDKRERRALERKISELEEDVKRKESESDNYKSDNARLKEENGALIRVISKLSK